MSLGGTPVGGGRGGLVGALLGATCIYLIQNLLSGLEVSAQWLDVVYGCVLIGAVILSSQLQAAATGGSGPMSVVAGAPEESRALARA